MTRSYKRSSQAANVRVKYGAYLKREREASRLTQKFVADHLGFRTPQLISNWERGITVPPLKDIERLAQLYSINHRELIEIVTEYLEAVCKDNLDYVKFTFEQEEKKVTNECSQADAH